MFLNTNGQFRPYIGNNNKICEKDVKTLDTRVSKYRIENSISDKSHLYWNYIRKGTVSQYIQVDRCIAKTFRTYEYRQP